MEAPRSEPPVDGETRSEQQARNRRNRLARAEWSRLASQRCAKCGQARINVRHETDPATSPEGPEYYRDILGQLHDFVAVSP